jgi:DNA gyrase/topoisomerase IV subunit B
VEKIERKKSSGVVILPEKLTDCEASDITQNELFLVEGDSAGGSAKQARDKRFQAIYKMRGKALNSWEVKRELLFSNAEIHDIAVAIGVDPHGPEADPDLSGLRYGKIASMTDADVDGAHIAVLLLTLFYRHFPKLIERGHIYVASPPLYKIDIPAQGKRPAKKLCTRRRGAQIDLRPCAGRGYQNRVAQDPAFQRAGGNESRAVVGNHAVPRYAAPVAGAHRRSRTHARDVQHADVEA